MRIPKQILLWSLLVLSLFAASAMAGSNGADVSVQADHEVAQDSSADTNHAITEAVPPIQTEKHSDTYAAFLSPSHIFDNIKNAYLPSALGMTDAVHALVESTPSASDFWEVAMKSQTTLQGYVYYMLESAATSFGSTKFTDITTSMEHIINSTATFHENIKGALDAQHITLDTLTEELEGIFTTIGDNLKKAPLLDKAPTGCAERAEMVDKVLDDTTRALLELAARHGIEAGIITTYLLELRPHIKALIAAICDINERYPQLLPALLFSVTILLIPQSWMLRSLLGVFGFGPAGPIKGSIAAWMQGYFWGAAVKAGSWFSLLQAAGMGVLPWWAGFVTKASLWIGGLASMLPSFNST